MGLSGGLADNGGLSLDYAKLAAVEPYSRPYTLYVNQADGSDSNKGNSPGQAFLTLTKAISTLQQSAHGGKIILYPVSAGSVDLSAPVAFVVPCIIEALVPYGTTIRRTFQTPNSRSVWDAVTTASGSSAQSATAAFVGGDVGRVVVVYGAGVQGGTYYDFISAVPDGTHATLTATTTVARNSTTDPRGVKLSVVGDWNRVVTDAAMTAGGSVITSATAAFTSADIGTEVVIAGAGQGGQALRSAIKSVTSTTATIVGVATATVTTKRCAIGVNFGSLFTWYGPIAGQSGIRYATVTDETGSSATIGSAVDLIAPDQAAGAQSNPADFDFSSLLVTSTGASGAWEHIITCDGSWNQTAAGPGVRRVNFHDLKAFGCRTPGETIRLVNPTHWGFTGRGAFASPTAIAQGIRILDPQNTAGYQVASEDVNFTGFEGVGAYFYSEGSRTNYIGGCVAPSVAISGAAAIELSPVSQNCHVVTTLKTSLTGKNASYYDAGANNRVELNTGKRTVSAMADLDVPTTPSLTYETFSRRGFTNASTAIGSTGVMILMSIDLPGGLQINRLGLVCGSTALNWGSGATGTHFICGIYDPDGNLFGQTADTGGTQAFTNNSTTNNINAIAKDGSGTAAASVRVPRTGRCYIGLLIHLGSSGTGQAYPNFAGYSNTLARDWLPILCATNGAGLTALPAPSITVPIVSGGAPSMIYGGVG